eukprot:1688984-Pyramimonas_sp.AAC.1
MKLVTSIHFPRQHADQNSVAPWRSGHTASTEASDNAAHCIAHASLGASGVHAEIESDSR